MISHLIELIRDVILPYGAIGVFFASIIEEVIAPIPSAFVLTASGFFLIPHGPLFESLWAIVITIAIPGALGVTIGSLFVYGIAYTYGKPALLRWGKYLGITWEEVEKFEKRFEKGYIDEIALFTARALPLIPSVVISSFCGLVRMPLKEYVLYSFLGTIIRGLFLGFIGWQVGDVYKKIATYLDAAEKFIFLFLFMAFLLFMGHRVYRRRMQG